MNISMRTLAVLVVVHSLAMTHAHTALGATQASVGRRKEVPPPPVPPAVVNRTAIDQVTIRAVRIAGPLTLDGRLDEEPYGTVQPIGDFVQQEPREGEPATEKTDAWVFFDDTALYISARCWDTQPDRRIANELRRDNSGIVGNDTFTMVLDTFYDRRNGFVFQTNPLGALRDIAVTDDAQNDTWNGVWYVKTGRFENAWTMEVAIPFKTLRYAGAGPQTWGINLRRLVKWKNELSYVSLVPAQYGLLGISRMDSHATLVGLETPSRTMNLEVKPYAVSSATTDRKATVPFDNKLKGSAGFDFKWGLTRGLIADATVNTDFAQIEEDLQQVNLTRFSLFFPEKRDFFIEGQGIFDFGGVRTRSTPGDVPLIFFSRQIGLSRGREVPVVAGGRLTGKAGPYSIGALNIQTGDRAEAGAVATNFTAVRVKREFLRRSSIGMVATHRSPRGATGRDSNTALGVDTTLLLSRNVNVTGYYAQTRTPDVADGDASYRGRFDYSSDRYGLAAEHMLIGDRFNPEMGYARRTDFRRNYILTRFSPRPRRSRVVRKLTWQWDLDYVTDARITTVENRETSGMFGIEFQNSDRFTVYYAHRYERVPQAFTIAPGVVVPARGYVTDVADISYNLGQQRKVSGRFTLARGSFYEGTGTTAAYSGRIGVVPQFSIEPSVSLNWADVPFGRFTSHLASTRFTFTPGARIFVSSLVQFNASARTLSSSVRLRWEYTGGSDLFVVYSEGRNTLTTGFPDLSNRTFAVKLTRLVRF